MPETLYWGLKFGELVTVVGLVLGPVVAVILTLGVETKRRMHEQRLHVMRMLLATRHIPSDAAYSVAINLIPVEFNSDRAVMEAWHHYLEIVQFTPTEENSAQHLDESKARQTKLIFAMMKSLGFKLAETDIQRSAYAAEAWTRREIIMIESWIAMKDIAETLKLQTQLISGGAETPAQPGQ